MSKSYQYVSKCICCEARFTRVSVPYMNVFHCSEIEKIARKAMVQHGFKGNLSLQCAGDTIINFFYQYKDLNDIAKSDLLYQLLFDLGRDYFNALTDEGVDWTYHPIEL